MAGDCIFCKIVKGEIPCFKVSDTKTCFAFLDINPINAGHVLVIPKEHHENILDTPAPLLSDAIALSQSIAQAIKEELGADGINVGMNNFAAAGQAVFHAHFHVIPRYASDGLRPWPHKSYQEGQALEIAKRLAKSVRDPSISR